MSYQLNSKKLFLTYPQCSLSKQDAYTELLITFGYQPFSKYIIAHELHENGDDHLHVYLEFDEAIRTRNPKFADLRGFHGNYQGCRSMKNVIKYVSKGDDYISNIDVSEITGKKNSKREIALKIISENLEPHEILKEYPELIFGYKKLKEDIRQYRIDCGDDREDLPGWLPNPWGKVLCSRGNRKRRHYWIYSRVPNMGKTTGFAKPMYKSYKCLLQAGDFTYWNVFGREQAIILDEYNSAKLGYASLNSMADGTFGYRVFLGGIITLKDPLIIILSNQPILEMYPHMNTLLYARFNEIELV